MSATETLSATVAPTAMVSPTASIGAGATIWDLSQIREDARIGANTTIGRSVYVDHDVTIGADCKIQNNSSIYWPAEVEDGVFIGPGVILTNDRHPRAVSPNGVAKTEADWVAEGVRVERGASIGAGAVVVGGVRVGTWAMVGAGAVVTRDVAAYSLVTGNPASHVAWIGKSGKRLVDDSGSLKDPDTGERFRVIDNMLEEAM